MTRILAGTRVQLAATPARSNGGSRLLVRSMAGSLYYPATNTAEDSASFTQSFAAGFTISAWLKATLAPTGVSAVINCRQDGNNRFGIASGSAAGRHNPYGFVVSGGTENDCNNMPVVSGDQALGQWRHYVFTYDPSLGANQMKFYSNGVLVTQATTALVVGTLTNAVLRVPAQGATWAGGLAEVRFWTAPLSANQVAALYARNLVPSANLLAEYLCNEVSGTTIHDTGPSARNIALGVGASFRTDAPLKARLAA